MATHSTVLTWKIPWTEEPGRLQSKWSRPSYRQLNEWLAAMTANEHVKDRDKRKISSPLNLKKV